MWGEGVALIPLLISVVIVLEDSIDVNCVMRQGCVAAQNMLKSINDFTHACFFLIL